MLTTLLLLAAVAAPAEEPPNLLGRCSVEQLREEPYGEWFVENYEKYEPNRRLASQLRDAPLDGLEVSVYFGTWCGDSRRELPRLLKLFDEIGLPSEAVTLIGVDRGPEVHKRSPGGEERGKEIYRVPTVVLGRGGDEFARIVEHPVLSLERDLAAILAGEPYEPNYRSFPLVRRWLAAGLLADENVSPRGLAAQVRSLVGSEGELASVGYVLKARGQLAEAIKLYEVNLALHRDSADAHRRLALALLQDGQLERARKYAERALELNDDPDRLPDLVALLDSTR